MSCGSSEPLGPFLENHVVTETPYGPSMPEMRHLLHLLGKNGVLRPLEVASALSCQVGR